MQNVATSLWLKFGSRSDKKIPDPQHACLTPGGYDLHSGPETKSLHHLHKWDGNGVSRVAAPDPALQMFDSDPDLNLIRTFLSLRWRSSRLYIFSYLVTYFVLTTKNKWISLFYSSSLHLSLSPCLLLCLYGHFGLVHSTAIIFCCNSSTKNH